MLAAISLSNTVLATYAKIKVYVMTIIACAIANKAEHTHLC